LFPLDSITQDGTSDIKTEETICYDVSCCQDNQGQGASSSLDSPPSASGHHEKPVDHPNEHSSASIECPIPSSSTCSTQVSDPTRLPFSEISTMVTLETSGQIHEEATTVAAVSKPPEVPMATGLQNSDVTIATSGSFPGTAPMATAGEIPGVVDVETNSPISGRNVMATSSSLPCGVAGGSSIPCGVAMVAGTPQMPCNVARDALGASEGNLQRDSTRK